MSQPTMTARPATWSGTSGPILYKLTSTNYAEAGYYMAVEVWNATTAAKIADAKYYANSSGVVTVDVSSFLKSAMSLDNTADLTTSDVVYTDGNWVKYYIKYREYWTASSESQVDDVANLRYAVYGGLQLGSTNDFSSKIDKFLSLHRDITLAKDYYVIISSIITQANSWVNKISTELGIISHGEFANSMGTGAKIYKYKESETADSVTFKLYNPTSLDGWDSKATPQNNTWSSVSTNGNGVWVAVSTNGTNRVMRSSDNGETWGVVAAVDANLWTSVAYGNGRFVAVSTTGTNRSMYSTDDGVTWTPVSIDASSWQRIVYGNSLFVIIALSGTTKIMTSPDAITWTARTPSVSASWTTLGYGNGLFVALSSSSTNAMYSSDAITWTTSVIISSTLWQSVTYGNGTFTAVGNAGSVMTSPDGITWTSRTATEANTWREVAFGNGIFMAVSSDGTTRSMYSLDGITWTAKAAAVANNWSSIARSADRFVAISETGTLDQAMIIDMVALDTITSKVYDCQNTVNLTWRNSLGGIECYPFTYNQEYTYDYGNGKKAKRLTLFANNLTLSQWEAIQGLNTLGDLYRSPITEMTTSLNRTSATIGQSVYVLNSDGSKIGVNVIGQANTTQTKQKTHSAFVTIEYPELFLQ